jgi:hypothetical protein
VLFADIATVIQHYKSTITRKVTVKASSIPGMGIGAFAAVDIPVHGANGQKVNLAVWTTSGMKTGKKNVDSNRASVLHGHHSYKFAIGSDISYDADPGLYKPGKAPLAGAFNDARGTAFR